MSSDPNYTKELRRLFDKYEIRPTGILHVGAHECEELFFYEKFTPRNCILWVEAIPEKVQMSRHRFPGILIENRVVSDEVETVKFNKSNNGQSSSLLNFGLHQTYHPTIKYVETIEVTTVLLKDVLKDYPLPFNFLNLDIQGAELKALKGMGEYLDKIEYIYIEVNDAQVYEGCCQVEDLDKFLGKRGFRRFDTKITEYHWGEALYIKSKVPLSMCIKTCGGLGNQMFPLFALLAEKMTNGNNVFLKRELCGDPVRGNYIEKDFLKCFSVLLDEGQEVPSYKAKWSENQRKTLRSYLEGYDGNILFVGLYQDYMLFHEKRKEIFKFMNLEGFQEDVARRCRHNFENTVSMHFRIGDYRNIQEFHNILPLSYYENALNQLIMDTGRKNWNILIFCDPNDHKIVKENKEKLSRNFSSLNFTCIPSGFKDYEEMIIMSLCTHNIIANSSFSWWGAYFNQKSPKVYYPEKWFGNNLGYINHKLLILPEWTEIEF